MSKNDKLLLEAHKTLNSSSELIIRVLTEENKKLREALEFYSDETNYNLNCLCCGVETSMEIDLGTRAREALGVK